MSSYEADSHRPSGRRYEAFSVSKSFDGVPALKGATVVFEPGEVHTLVGENGAGKSTLLKILAGIYQPDSGKLVLGGQRLRTLTPRSAQQLGIYLVPQEPALMPHLSVTENLFLGILRRGRLPFSLDWRSMRREAASYLLRVGLDLDPDLRAEELSIAQQQLVECARALVHRCDVIFFDEPTSPLTAHEARRLFEVMARLKASRFTLGFISHRLGEVLEVSDRVTVLRDGQIIKRAERGQLDQSSLVVAMVGREVKMGRVRLPGPQTGPEILSVEGLTARPLFEDVSFRVRAGEILGFAGLVGSGRTEIAEAVFGLRPTEEGTVRVGGRLLERRTPRSCIDAGLVYLPEDRARYGIFADVEITRNVTSAVVPQLPSLGPLLQARPERQMAREATSQTSVRMASLASLMKTLSGGNQQRSMIARWLLAGPKIAIFDEPTRGVDVGAKEDIYKIVSGLARQGLACVIISSELGELVQVCDRVMAIYEGHVVGEVSGEDITEANLGELVVGAGLSMGAPS